MCHANTFFSNSCKKKKSEAFYMNLKRKQPGASILAFTVDGRIQINSKFLTLHDIIFFVKKWFKNTTTNFSD